MGRHYIACHGPDALRHSQAPSSVCSIPSHEEAASKRTPTTSAQLTLASLPIVDGGWTTRRQRGTSAAATRSHLTDGPKGHRSAPYFNVSRNTNSMLYLDGLEGPPSFCHPHLNIDPIPTPLSAIVCHVARDERKSRFSHRQNVGRLTLAMRCILVPRSRPLPFPPEPITPLPHPCDPCRCPTRHSSTSPTQPSAQRLTSTATDESRPTKVTLWLLRRGAMRAGLRYALSVELILAHAPGGERFSGKAAIRHGTPV